MTEAGKVGERLAQDFFREEYTLNYYTGTYVMCVDTTYVCMYVCMVQVKIKFPFIFVELSLSPSLSVINMSNNYVLCN